MSNAAPAYTQACFARDDRSHAILNLSAYTDRLRQGYDLDHNLTTQLDGCPTAAPISDAVDGLWRFGLLTWEFRDATNTQYARLTELGERVLARWNDQLGVGQ